jgi:hypothetical protein
VENFFVCITASAQVPLASRDGSWWKCPQLQVQPNFNVRFFVLYPLQCRFLCLVRFLVGSRTRQHTTQIPRYMGLWYEIDRYWYAFPEYSTYCSTAQVPTQRHAPTPSSLTAVFDLMSS